MIKELELGKYYKHTDGRRIWISDKDMDEEKRAKDRFFFCLFGKDFFVQQKCILTFGCCTVKIPGDCCLGMNKTEVEGWEEITKEEYDSNEGIKIPYTKTMHVISPFMFL